MLFEKLIISRTSLPQPFSVLLYFSTKYKVLCCDSLKITSISVTNLLPVLTSILISLNWFIIDSFVEVAKSYLNNFALKATSLAGEKALYSPSKYLNLEKNIKNFSSILFSSWDAVLLNVIFGASKGGFLINKISSSSKPFSPYPFARSIFIHFGCVFPSVKIKNLLLLSVSITNTIPVTR